MSSAVSAVPAPSVSPPATDSSCKKRKRPRAARACEQCRAKKYGCDELHPCTQCKRHNVECIYKGIENLSQRASSYVAELEKKVMELTAKQSASLSPHPASAGHTSSFTTPGKAFSPITPQIPHDRLPMGMNRRHAGVGGPIEYDGRSHWTPREASSSLRPSEQKQRAETEAVAESDGELKDMNRHTNSLEFHGNTSSMSFLALVESQNPKDQQSPRLAQDPELATGEKTSLVNTLHNVAFTPDSDIPSNNTEITLNEQGFYFRHAHVFLDGYFESLHFVHPFLVKEEFISRCEDLWFGRSERQKKSFIALYYSILSLGALVRVWDEQKLDGMNRFQWSRKLYGLARHALGKLGTTNDLESVQCLIFMAKVCQNELNPHLAYMYLGLAVRSSISAGYHRESPSQSKTQTPGHSSAAISNTWWGLYSLEIELSFSLGRPDSIGLDEYHNRRQSPITDSEVSIIPCMVPFARLTRRVSIAIYLSSIPIMDRIPIALDIELEMDSWLHSLPERIRPGSFPSQRSGMILLQKDPKWARRQRLVLHLRNLNVRMVLFRPFLVHAIKSTASNPMQPLHAQLDLAVRKCIDAARQTTETMFNTFSQHVFFRSWWYNTTYTLYAASILLCFATKLAPLAEKPSYFQLVDMTVEILEAMSESVVAMKAGTMIKQALADARYHTGTMRADNTAPSAAGNLMPPQPPYDALNSSIDGILTSQLPFSSMEPAYGYEGIDFPLNEALFMFSADYGLDGFGT